MDASGSSCARRLLALVAVAAIGFTACGGDDDAPEASAAAEAPSDASAADDGSVGAGRSPVEAACDLTDPEVVAEIFGGAVGGETAGSARNCDYPIDGGKAIVSAFHYGTGEEWDGIRRGYEANRGPLTDVEGVGEQAYHPADVGTAEIVVLTGDVAFALSVTDRSAEGAAKLKELAERIAAEVG